MKRLRAKTLTWADTGKPVKSGDLAPGEWLEFELATGKTRRLPKENIDGKEATEGGKEA
jgi:hypothetical protein